MHTVYFPLTANPVGYHHLLLAECVLRQLPEMQNVVFILSNGKHPDPLKAGLTQQQIPDASVRLEILRNALFSWTDPEKSLPAKIVQNESYKSGNSLKLQKDCCAILRSELAFERPLRLAEHVRNLAKTGKVSLIVGADLIDRMNNPQIFTDADLAELERRCRLLAVPRNNLEIEPLLRKLSQNRGFNLEVTPINLTVLPRTLQPFLLLSSTFIRRAFQAGHDLRPFLPVGPARQIRQSGLYASPQKKTGEWQLRCYELMEQLDEVAKILKILLDQRSKSYAKQNLRHRFAVVECGSGGQISAAFSGIPGASAHFLEGRIAYSQTAQEDLIGRSLSGESSVSEKRARELAIAIRRHSGSGHEADWTLAESGMAGPPSAERRSGKNGQSHLAIAFSGGVRHKYLELNPFLTRKEHQLLFAVEALSWATTILREEAEK